MRFLLHVSAGSKQYVLFGGAPLVGGVRHKVDHEPGEEYEQHTEEVDEHAFRGQA